MQILGRNLPPAEEPGSWRKPMVWIPNPRLFSFVGGRAGPWKFIESRAITGDALPAIARLDIVAENVAPTMAGAVWVLHGVTSNERYVTRPEKEQLLAKQQGLDRPEADCAVLIPIRKNAKWWAMTQDERRKIFEEQSHHTQIGLDYLPAIARRLHHCRDLAAPEPFDFLIGSSLRRRTRRSSTSCSRASAPPRNGATSSAKWRFGSRATTRRQPSDGRGRHFFPLKILRLMYFQMPGQNFSG